MEYFYLIILILFSFILGCLLYAVSYFFVLKNLTVEKASTYECGFTPFSDSRDVFEVEFYLVAILFVIFDLEIMFLFPWVLVVSVLPLYGILSMFLFLFLILLVFFYEWSQGILDW